MRYTASFASLGVIAVLTLFTVQLTLQQKQTHTPGQDAPAVTPATPKDSLPGLVVRVAPTDGAVDR